MFTHFIKHPTYESVGAVQALAERFSLGMAGVLVESS